MDHLCLDILDVALPSGRKLSSLFFRKWHFCLFSGMSLIFRHNNGFTVVLWSLKLYFSFPMWCPEILHPEFCFLYKVSEEKSTTKKSLCLKLKPCEITLKFLFVVAGSQLHWCCTGAAQGLESLCAMVWEWGSIHGPKSSSEEVEKWQVVSEIQFLCSGFWEDPLHRTK